jgi:hypothetical protein
VDIATEFTTAKHALWDPRIILVVMNISGTSRRDLPWTGGRTNWRERASHAGKEGDSEGEALAEKG